MTVGDDDRDIVQGDLVYIPPNVVHSLRPVTDNAPDPLLLLRLRRARHRLDRLFDALSDLAARRRRQRGHYGVQLASVSGFAIHTSRMSPCPCSARSAVTSESE